MAQLTTTCTVNKHVVFLSNSFIINNKRHKVTINVELNPSSSLSSSCLTWEPEGKSSKRESVYLSDIITAHHWDHSKSANAKSKKKHSNSEELPLHSTTSFQIHYAKRKSKSCRLWTPQSVVLRHSQSAVIQQWVIAIQGILREQDRPQRLLVFINPFGGKKKAEDIYKSKVEPLFRLAGIDTHVVVTKRANHALEFVQEVDIQKFDGLVAVGGDGLYCEVLTGLLLRTQAENKINMKDPSSELIRPTMRLGIIPAGSTDAVVYCTTGAHDPVNSALLIILGSRVSIDMCTVYSNADSSLSEQKFLRFSTCMMAYGYFGDTLLDSEKHRWMGPARYDWSGMKSFLVGKTYEGTLKMKKDSAPGKHDPRKPAKCRVGCEKCRKAGLGDCNKNSDDADAERSTNHYPPGFNDNSDYEVITGKFWAINAATMTCKCARTKRGISPSAHIGDGYTDVVVIRKTSRINYLRYLIRTAFRTDSPFDLDFVSVYRVKMFSFVPSGVLENNTLTRASCWNSDGEIVREPSVDVRVHCQLVPLFARGIYEIPVEPSCCVRICKKKTVPSDVPLPYNQPLS